MRKIVFLACIFVGLSATCFAQNNARMLSTPNSQTGTSYTFVAADTTRVTTFNSGSPVSVTLPNGATQGFGPGTLLSVVNLGSGVVTITCSACTINGAATLALSQNQSADIYGGYGSPPVSYTAALGSGTGGGIPPGVAPNQSVIYVSQNCGTQTNCFPAKFDVQVANAASSTVSSTTVTTGASDPPFVPGVVGDLIFGTGHFFRFEGFTGSLDLPLGTITSFVSAHQVTVSVAATASNTGNMELAWGHDDTANIAAAVAQANALAAIGIATTIVFPQGTAFVSKGMNAPDALAKGTDNFSTGFVPLPNFDFTTGAGNSCSGFTSTGVNNACFAFGDSADLFVEGLGQPISGTPNVVLFTVGGNSRNLNLNGWGDGNASVVGAAIFANAGSIQTNLTVSYFGETPCDVPSSPLAAEVDLDAADCDANTGTALLVGANNTLTGHNLLLSSISGNTVDATAAGASFIDNGGNDFVVGPLVGNITHTPTYATLTSGNCVQAGAGGLLATVAAPCGAGSGTPGTPLHSLQFNSASAFAGTSVPATNGQYAVGYTVTAGAAVDPTVTQLGSVPRIVGGTTSTDTIAYTDNLTPVIYNGSVAVATALPTPTTLGNTGFTTKLINNTSGSATAVTVTSTTLTFDRNGTTTLTVQQGEECTLTADPGGTKWDTSCHWIKLVAGTNITITPGQFGPTIAASSGGAFSGGLGASFQDATEIAAPANPSAGNDRLFLNSSTHLLDCHTSAGATCMPSSGGLSGLTANTIPIATSPTAIGNGPLSFDGTGTLTGTPTSGTQFVYTAPPGDLALLESAGIANAEILAAGTGDVIAAAISSAKHIRMLSGVVHNFSAVTFSATPTFNAGQFDSFEITLTGNVTSSTVSNPLTGEWISFIICQDATGSRTFAWPANFKGTGVIGSAASTCSSESFMYDGTSWFSKGAIQTGE